MFMFMFCFVNFIFTWTYVHSCMNTDSTMARPDLKVEQLAVRHISKQITRQDDSAGFPYNTRTLSQNTLAVCNARHAPMQPIVTLHNLERSPD